MKALHQEKTVKTGSLQSSPQQQHGRGDRQSDSFADNRPQAHEQTAIQQMADASPQGDGIAQLQVMAGNERPNRTGLPDSLKAGVENLPWASRKTSIDLDKSIRDESLQTRQVQLPTVQTSDLHPAEIGQLKQQLTQLQNPNSHPIQALIKTKKAIVENNQVMMPPSGLKPSSTGSDILQAVTQLQPKDTKLSVFGNQYAVDLKLNPWLRIASGKVTWKSLRDPLDAPGEWIFVNDGQFQTVAIGDNWPSESAPSPLISEMLSTIHSSTQTASTLVALPPIQVNPEMFPEVSRQLQLQLAGLNQLSAKEWLMNVLQNRLKSTDQLVAEGMGTETGKRLGQKIDNLLIENDDLARILMERVIQNMECLKAIALREPELAKLIEGIQQAARVAYSHKTNVYQMFRHLKGIDHMELLSRIGLEGGLGRQHGEGDEKDFRTRHLQGIAHLKELKPELEKNACLHNPDQCAGGPMEILWHLAHQGQIKRTQDWYDKVATEFRNAKYLWESYQRTPPKTISGSIDQRMMDDASNHYLQLEDEIEQATAAYMEAIHQHLGTYNVNSLLGRTWMEAISAPDAINRVDMILNRVLQIPFDQLARTPMNVVMNVQVRRPVAISSTTTAPIGMFPDVISGNARSESLPKPVKHRKTVDQRLVEKRKQIGPRQQTLGDMEFQKRQRDQAPLSSSFDHIQTHHNIGADGVLIFDTWADANMSLLRRGQEIRIIHHSVDISDRVFRLLIDYDPFTMHELRTGVSIEWVR